MSQIYKNSASSPPPVGTVLFLTPDAGADVGPNGLGEIAVTGTQTGLNQSVPDSNFKTFNAGNTLAGIPALQVAHRYQGAATTIGLVTTTILTIAMTAASTMNIDAQIVGIESTPLGVGGEVRGTVFMGALGTATVLGIPDKVIRASAPLAGCTFTVGTNIAGDSLIINVTGVAGHTIEWYVIAEIVLKTFI